MIVFKRIADLRIDHDLTQIDLSKKLNIKSNTYSKWERGINIIPLEMLFKLSNIYNVSLDYLLGITSNKSSSTVKSINYNVIGRNMKLLRDEKGYTQAYVSEIIEISQRNYSNYESANRKIKTDTLYKLVLLYKVSFDWICSSKEKRG